MHRQYFVKLLSPQRLYFYAGKIIYPNYDIYEPIEGMHEALIDEETMKRIFIRLKEGNRPRINDIKHDKKHRVLTSILLCAGCNKGMYGCSSYGNG